MKKLILFTSILEASLGILLILFPSLVIKLIFGIDTNDEMNLLSRFTGIVFFCFGLTCYPLKEVMDFNNMLGSVRGMFSYNLIASVFFGYLKIENTYDGILLLPAFILHSLITVYFIFLMRKQKKN